MLWSQIPGMSIVKGASSGLNIRLLPFRVVGPWHKVLRLRDHTLPGSILYDAQ